MYYIFTANNSLWYRQQVSFPLQLIRVEVDVNLLPADVLQLHDPAGAGVDRQVPPLLLHEVPDGGLDLHPVAPIEDLPLRGHVDEEVG